MSSFTALPGAKRDVIVTVFVVIKLLYLVDFRRPS